MQDKELTQDEIDKIVDYQFRKLEKEYLATTQVKDLNIDLQKDSSSADEKHTKLKEDDADGEVNDDEDNQNNEEQSGDQGNYAALSDNEDGKDGAEDDDEDWDDFQTSHVKEVAEEKPAEPPRFKDLPMDKEVIEKIKNTMAKIHIKPPAWAEKIPEEQWMQKLGFK